MVVWIGHKLWRYFAILLIGTLIGGAVVTARIGAMVDDLSIKNSELAQRLESTESELGELKKNLANQRRQVVTGTEINVSLTENNLNHFSEEPTKLALEKKIQQLLKPVVGQDVKTLNYALLPQLVEGRVVTVDNTSFILHVKTLVLADKLVLYVAAAPQRKTQ